MKLHLCHSLWSPSFLEDFLLLYSPQYWNKYNSMFLPHGSFQWIWGSMHLESLERVLLHSELSCALEHIYSITECPGSSPASTRTEPTSWQRAWKTTDNGPKHLGSWHLWWWPRWSFWLLIWSASALPFQALRQWTNIWGSFISFTFSLCFSLSLILPCKKKKKSHIYLHIHIYIIYIRSH